MVTLADGNYFDQARQLFSSVYHNSGWKGDYMILSLDMKKDQQEWFDEKGIIVKRIQNIGNIELPNHPKTVLGKFHIFDRDLSDWKRIIYLDADTTVTSSLDRLIDLEGFWAVVDFHDMRLSGQFKVPGTQGFGSKEKRALDRLASNFDLSSISFNSGVMAFDGDMSGDDAFGQILRLYKEYEPIALHDQSILNLFFYGRWQRLPLVYNNYFLYCRRPGSIHFEKCDGIVNHFILDRVWKTKNKDHYPSWKTNLNLADNIDLVSRPGPLNIWTETREEKVSGRLEASTIRKDTISGRVLSFMTLMDRAMGRVGLFLNGKTPKLYDILRKKPE